MYVLISHDAQLVRQLPREALSCFFACLFDFRGVGFQTLRLHGISIAFYLHRELWALANSYVLTHCSQKKKYGIQINERNISLNFHAVQVRYVMVCYEHLVYFSSGPLKLNQAAEQMQPRQKYNPVRLHHRKITLENFCYFFNPICIQKLYVVVLH